MSKQKIKAKVPMVEIIEIWMPVAKGGEVHNFKTQQNLKRVALLAGEQVLYLEKDFVLEKQYITKEEENNLTTNEEEK